MASLFSPPKQEKVKPVKTADAGAAQAAINLERRRSSGSYQSTILGSGLKTALGQ